MGPLGFEMSKWTRHCIFPPGLHALMVRAKVASRFVSPLQSWGMLQRGCCPSEPPLHWRAGPASHSRVSGLWSLREHSLKQVPSRDERCGFANQERLVVNPEVEDGVFKNSPMSWQTPSSLSHDANRGCSFMLP